MTFVNLGEVYYRVAKERGVPAAEQALLWLEALPVQFVEAGRRLTLEAARLNGRYALSYADCFAAALARQLDAAVVTGDTEFEQLEGDGVVEIEWLQPKPKSRRR